MLFLLTIIIPLLTSEIFISNPIDFKDVAGAIPIEIKRIAEHYKAPKSTAKESIPHRIIIIGPSRSGKTFLMKALAGQLNATVLRFIDFHNKHLIKKAALQFSNYIQNNPSKLIIIAVSDECMGREQELFFSHDTLKDFFIESPNVIIIAETTHENYDKEFLTKHFDAVVRLDNSVTSQQTAFINFFLSKLSPEEYLHAHNEIERNKLVEELIHTFDRYALQKAQELSAMKWADIIRTSLQKAQISGTSPLTNKAIVETANEEFGYLSNWPNRDRP